MKKFRSSRSSTALSRRFASSGPPAPAGPASMEFSSGKYLTIPASSLITLGTSNHTIEFWMYQTSRAAYDCLFSYDIATGATTTSNYYFNVGSSQFMLILGGGGGGWAFIIDCGTAPSLNAWHHYAVVRNGNTFTVYLDGVSVGSTVSANLIPAQTGSMGVGNDSYGDTVTGYITDFRLVKSAVYTANFTRPSTYLTSIPNTVFLIQGFADNGPNTFTVTNVNSATGSTLSPYA